MKSVSEITADDIVRGDIEALNFNESLSKVKSRMESLGLKNMPVIQGKVFRGMISYRELIKESHSNPKTTKLSKVMHQPPEISGDENLASLAAKRINSGRRKFVILDGKSIVGVIGEEEMVYALSKGCKELKNLSVEDLSDEDVFTIMEDMKLDKARSLMIDKGISRLPVVDKNNKLVGIVREFDVLKELMPREKMNKGDVKGEKGSFSNVPVREVMNRTPLFTDEKIPITDCIGEMEREGSPDMILRDNGEPRRILTLKDILNYLANYSVEDYIRVNLVGVDTDSEKSAIHEKVKKAFQGAIGRVLKNPEELEVIYKKSEKEGKRHRYELVFKLSSELGVISVKEEGWDLLNVVDSALNGLEKIVKKEVGKRKDRRH